MVVAPGSCYRSTGAGYCLQLLNVLQSHSGSSVTLTATVTLGFLSHTQTFDYISYVKFYLEPIPV